MPEAAAILGDTGRIGNACVADEGPRWQSMDSLKE
jgi:hypothetical protein